jgi:hypothetical protein
VSVVAAVVCGPVRASMKAGRERVGNYQAHPYWDVLLDQLWVR